MSNPPYEIWNQWERQIRWMRLALMMMVTVLGLMTIMFVSLWRQRVVVVGANGEVVNEQRVSETATLEPTKNEVLSFAEEFLRLYLAPNSQKVEQNYKRAVAMMSHELRQQHETFSAKTNYVGKIQGMGIETDMTFSNMMVEKKSNGLLNVYATGQQRTIASKSAAVFHPFKGVVVLRSVGRSERNPIGLEVVYLDYEIAPS